MKADKEALQSDLAAAELRCTEAEKQSQASLENEHATPNEVQLLRRQLTEARWCRASAIRFADTSILLVTDSIPLFSVPLKI